MAKRKTTRKTTSNRKPTAKGKAKRKGNRGRAATQRARQAAVIVEEQQRQERERPTQVNQLLYLWQVQTGARCKYADEMLAQVCGEFYLTGCTEGSAYIHHLNGDKGPVTRQLEVIVVADPQPGVDVAQQRQAEIDAKKRERQEAREAKAAAKAERKPVERDRFGNRVGTQAADINALCKGKRPITIASVHKKTKLREGRIKDHFRYLVSHKYAKWTTGEKGITLTGKTA